MEIYFHEFHLLVAKWQNAEVIGKFLGPVSQKSLELFGVQEASCQTAIHLFWKADILTYGIFDVRKTKWMA